ncbi:MAG: translation elongation factor Ts [SAR324 cluster bacterium]|uniref:Elongation factor Ts n=1 Tax=SAR324 cluster bacterium TaxID=2024889 RepID=A0A2A4SPD7_9DELT|nr:MAG: translation elongation factor Ts [SAR324 cluster bacterium]
MAKITASMVKELREITGAAMMDCKRALTETNGDLEEAKENLRKKGQAIANKKSSRETKEGGISIYTGENVISMVKIACETDFVAINDKFKNFLSAVGKQVAETGVEGYVAKTTEDGTDAKELFVTTIAGLGENIVFLEGLDWKQAESGVFGGYVHSNGKIGAVIELVAEGIADQDAATNVAKDIAMHIAASHVEAISESDLDPAVIEKEKAFLIDQAKDSGKPMEIIEKMVVGRLKKFKKEICLLDQNFVKDPSQSISDLLKAKGKELGGQFKVNKFHKFSF